MRLTICSIVLLATIIAVFVAATPSVEAAAAWTSPNKYRVMLTVDPQDVVRRHSPASVDIDLQQELVNKGSAGAFDEHTVEVIAYDANGQPVVYDASRAGYEKYLLPHHIEPYYPITRITLSFIMPNETFTEYAVYFDTKESGLGKPQRYSGIVGIGDKFVEEYKRREVAANVHDDFADLNGNGRLDLFKGGVEPFVYCYENIGNNEYVYRGKLTSGGQVMTFPHQQGNNRSWIKVNFTDWNNNGKQDLLLHFAISDVPVNYTGNIVWYENVTQPGGPLTFQDRGMIKTVTDKPINYTITVVDWDGDGKKDILSAPDATVTFFKNIGTDSNPVFADGEYVKANGTEIVLLAARMDCADVTGNGALDLFAGSCDGKVYWFENVGTRTNPILMEGRLVVFHEGGYSDLQSGVKLHDFDGDGLMDMVVGCYWMRTHWPEQPRVYGRLYKNIGTATEPLWEERDAYNGAPYTETFQQCDALLQNGMRATDWDGDGLLDLIASDTDGFVWFFKNLTNHLFPVFATGERLRAGDGYVKVQGEAERRMRDGYARVDIADWNNDGRKDLLVGDGGGWVWLYLNEGTPTEPMLGAGQRVYANGKPIDGTARSSVLVCDWDNDGRKDLIHAVTGQGTVSEHWDWPWQRPDPSWDSGYLFYKNIGTDAEPVLAYPEWIRGGGQIITYNSRPNLGSFVDWDGDGKKDFITGEFESSARFYKNIGSGLPGEKPVFADTTGVHLVKPWSVQMMSGADAVNWRGISHPNRPAYDILTGQGHGGSGLRYYCRDFIEDFINNTYPSVALGAWSQADALENAKSLANNTTITVPAGIVTANLPGCFYIQSDNRASGIRVEGFPSGADIGNRVDVSGTIMTNSHGERYILATSMPVPNGQASVTPVAMSGKGLGGADFRFNPYSGAGQRGVADKVGLNNIGLLVTITGRCTLNLAVSGPGYDNDRSLFIDDGSGVVSWYRAADGSYLQVEGVKVDVVDASIQEGDYVVVTGISSIEKVNGSYQSRVLPRPGMGDVAAF